MAAFYSARALAVSIAILKYTSRIPASKQCVRAIITIQAARSLTEGQARSYQVTHTLLQRKMHELCRVVHPEL
jgi:hypothetical protein